MLTSERVYNAILDIAPCTNNARAIADVVAKYERVARAAKAIFGVEGMKNLRPLYEELEAALADLPEDALK